MKQEEKLEQLYEKREEAVRAVGRDEEEEIEGN